MKRQRKHLNVLNVQLLSDKKLGNNLTIKRGLT